MKLYSFILFSLVAAAIIVFWGASRVLAIDPLQKVAQRYGITFPIKELGGCTSWGQCRQFCDDPNNQPTCIAFAKTKGFYKGDLYKQRRAAALSFAQRELSCNSEKACRDVCQQSENQEKCTNFAQKYNLPQKNLLESPQTGILEQAKTTLGCDSVNTCMNFCSQEANKQKCSTFANQIGLKGGVAPQGPGGCTSPESCKVFCSDPNHFSDCKNFISPPNSIGGTGTFRGPGGCDSESSCKTYCDQHHEECYTLMQSASSSPGTPNSPTPSINHPLPNGSQDPASLCQQTSGCTWTGTTCQCPGGTSSSTTQTYSGLSSSGPLIDCTGPDGKHFQATQAQCDYFNNAWKTAQPSGTSVSSGGSPTTQTSTCGTDPACWCRQCGGQWTGTTCSNPTSCH